MGTFGIFAIVATIILLGYYVVIITLDCHKDSKKEKKEDVEIIHTTEQETPEPQEEEKPVDVDEESFLHESSSTEEQPSIQGSAPPSENTSEEVSEDEINNLSASELHDNLEKAKNQMITCKAEAEHEISAQEFVKANQNFQDLSSEMVESLEQLNV